MSNFVFVFGSNLAGIHGAGAAYTALKQDGAIMGVGVGIQGDSYGIPTKDENINTMPLKQIQKHVNDFMQYAGKHLGTIFQVTKIGCGLAGYKDSDIAPMFVGASPNCVFDIGWKYWVGDKYSFFKF
jgi:hypothetical protein